MSRKAPYAGPSGFRSRSVPQAAIPFFSALAILYTWPMLRFAGSRVIDLGDGLLSAWQLTAVARRLVTHPLTLFDVNMYYPYRQALATLDHQLSTVLLVAPIVLATGNPLLAANLFTIATFALAGVFTAMLVADLTGSLAGGLVGGCVYAFSAMRLENLTHTHVLGSCWLPLALLAVHRYAREPSWRRLWFAVVAFLWLALASWYYAIIGGVALAIVGAAELVRARPNRWIIARRALVGVLPIVAVLAALARPYVAIARDYLPHLAHAATVRTTTDGGDVGPAIDRAAEPVVIQEMSNPVENYLGVASGTRAPWTARLRSVSRTVGSRFFPGFVAVAFGAVAAFSVVRLQVRGVPAAWVTVVLIGMAGLAVVVAGLDLRMEPVIVLRSIPGFFLLVLISLVAWLFTGTSGLARLDGSVLSARTYFVLGAVGLLLSLGATVRAFGVPLGQGVYPATLPPFDLLRASGRFGVLFSMSAAVLTGFGYAAVTRRLGRPTLRHALAIVALLIVNGELYAGPVEMWSIGRMPDVYEWLKEAPAGPVIEFPIHGRLLAFYWSLYHRQPMVNGFGVVEPDAFKRLRMWDDLSPDMLAHIRSYLHPRYVIVDSAKYAGDEARTLAENLPLDHDELRLVARIGTREVFEIGGPSRGAIVLRSYPAWMVEGKRDIAVRAHLEGAPTRGTPVLQIWGNGQLLRSTQPDPFVAEPFLTVPLPADTARGLDVEIMADYTLPVGAGAPIGRTGRLAAADIALTVDPQRTRIQVNGHVWIGHKGYTVVAVSPDGHVSQARAFNTSWSEDESHALAAYLRSVPPGSTVAVATTYDASRALTADAVQALREVGLATDLRGHFRWAHAAIGLQGAPAGTAVESLGQAAAACSVGTPIAMVVTVDDAQIR